MISRRESAAKKAYKAQWQLRYQKNRQRNVLAKPGVHAFVPVLDHLKAGPNVAKIFRSAQVFGARELHLIHIGPFDPAPAKGAFRKVPACFFDHFEQSYRRLVELGYTVYVLEPGRGRPLNEVRFAANAAFVFGHEEHGIQFEITDYQGIQSIHIPQFGELDSLNVSVAASIVMYEYVRQQQLTAATEDKG